uniref:NADH-ubiquinone oxidoreductase chain 2 n=1 Tax=Cernuella virgata TaxID=145650 RepID=A0A1B0TKT9_9EUPU|nr:NADH dehydrogenase subunit 2 [Cernuella virgata]
MSSGWIMIILMMELGLFFFVFMCMEYNLLSIARSCLKYFMIQSVSSLLLLVSGLLLFSMLDLPSWLVHLFFLVGVTLKLGAFPMLFWVIPVLGELPFILIGMVGCPLKVLPLMMYSAYYASCNPPVGVNGMNFISLLTMVSGVWLGLHVKTTRGMLGASSISHTGWFILSTHSASIMKYFMCYAVSLIMVLYYLWGQNSFMGALNLLGLAGLPPFSVFVGKIIVVYTSLRSNISEVFLMLAMLVSAVSLFYYLKFSFSMYLYNSNVMPHKFSFAGYFPFMVNCAFALLFLCV